ncbi:MAG: hypothetical protein CME62_15715 [Halobacteriovoraceae bacterium]|nr:hypothetical protein [Halobacteriovoraceae bacterium]|tara:strand:+ start:15116 stop:15736 length:621 start_codon:yes stop_codon:yes gene_type:complete
MSAVKVFLIFLLSIFLAEASLAGFIPKAFEGDFEQIKKDRRGRDRTEPVKILYSTPQSIKMTTETKGLKTILVCNPEKTWIYNEGFGGEPGQVRVGDSAKYCYSQIFDVLARGLTDNKFYKVKNLSKHEFKLTFSKNATSRLGYDEVDIKFKSKPHEFSQIEHLVLINKDKSPVKLKLKKLQVVSKFDKETFVFQIPKGAETQQMN